jgi:outer membrane protein, heavy metal efflux system
MEFLWARAMAACVTACCALSDVAAESKSLTLREAVELAVQLNPELAAFADHTAAASEQSSLQALSPSPVVELQFENFAGTGVLSGTNALETTLQFSRIVELGNKRRLRQQLGEGELDRMLAGQRARHTDVLAEVARRFIEVLADQERLAAMERSVTLAEQTGRAVRSRVEAGAASPVQSSRAAISLARAQIELEHAEHELLASRVALATLWSEETPSFVSASGDLFKIDAQETFERYRQRLDQNPDLLVFASMQRVLDARSGLAEAQQRPNLTFNVGVRRLEALDDSALVAGIAVPIGTSRRGDIELRSARAERSALALTERSRRMELHATLFGLYQELTHARTETEALRERVRPQARQMLETTQVGYDAGRFSFLELADAQRQLLEIELESIDSATNFHLQLIEIERLTGQPVAGPAQESSR